jgi:fido (protein-threonine AMPylation protein)
MKAESRKKRGRPSLEDLLALLDEEVALLHDHLGGLPRAVEADHILREIWIDDVHNSTAIEGNTMTRAQVADLVERYRLSADLTEALEVEGYAKAADWVYRRAAEYKEGVSVATVSQVHQQAMTLVWEVDPPATRDRPGAWRQTGVRVRNLEASLPPAIPGDLGAWSDSTRRMESHPIIHAALHHAWLERIHPFVDGNGRVGRLILNFMLIQEGYPPGVILATKRPGYLQALRTADRGNPGPLAEVVARAVRGTLTRFLIPNLAGDAKLVPLSALATHGPYSAPYLRQLAGSGRLRAVRDGRLYLSSRAWLSDYIARRDPRGGQPRGSRPAERLDRA